MASLFGRAATLIHPGSFDSTKHYYPKVLNAQLHPLVSFFKNMRNSQIAKRYCHLNPQVCQKSLMDILSYHPRYIPWAGSDLFHVTTANGIRRMVIIETNSCPSGQKSMPLFNEHQEQGGYHELLNYTFKSYINVKRGLSAGRAAVVYDKNPMENSGYAVAMADMLQEDVFLVEFYDNDPDPSVRFTDGVMEVRDHNGHWHPIRLAFRYVTQRPWNRIPLHTKTLIMNPIIACLAGGRNKMVAAKAYDVFNAEIGEAGLRIRTPETISDIEKNEIPLWVKKFSGHAVIKVPYSNAGQGVYTITNEQEIEDFMNCEHQYNQFIVQSLIGNAHWSTKTSQGKYYHIGTVPNHRNQIYVVDIRMMVSSGPAGFRPLAIYSRRTKTPLVEHLDNGKPSWDMLGTNLSYKNEDGTWGTDTTRLLLMDRKDFNMQGVGLDDLIDAYIQTVLSVTAIDKMAKALINQKGKFRKKLFKSLNHDRALLDEIVL
ncbi:MAG: hypothetical protein ACMUIP_06250 [bacterium]